MYLLTNPHDPAASWTHPHFVSLSMCHCYHPSPCPHHLVHLAKPSCPRSVPMNTQITHPHRFKPATTMHTLPCHPAPLLKISPLLYPFPFCIADKHNFPFDFPFLLNQQSKHKHCQHFDLMPAATPLVTTPPLLSNLNIETLFVYITMQDCCQLTLSLIFLEVLLTIICSILVLLLPPQCINTIAQPHIKAGNCSPFSSLSLSCVWLSWFLPIWPLCNNAACCRPTTPHTVPYVSFFIKEANYL